MKLAPTDPIKKKPSFYIMRNKEIFAQPQPSGRGICFLYEDGGRLISSAKIVGNIEDESMLDLLKSTEGFRKLVHSIGITVLTESGNDTVKFVFQMYGKTDLYGTGTNLVSEQQTDGMENVIVLDAVDWSSDDKEPGQIRFEFEKEMPAKISVCFYLNDGFTAPPVTEEEEVDITTPLYREMIERSLVKKGDLTRIKRAIKKAKDGEDVTIAYIGGSITQGAGATPINTECYACKSFTWFADTFGNGSNVHFVKAGVGGTPSELGMIRFERDVLRYGTVDEPDIVIVEFAVNDDGDETEGDCFESLVRKALMLKSEPAVLIMFSVFANDYNLQERLIPVGEKLDLPMVSVKNAVVPQFTDPSIRVLTKNQYFYDIFHPSNLGHTIMADGIKLVFEKASAELDETGIGEDKTKALLSEEPAIGKTFEKVVLSDKKDNPELLLELDEGGFVCTDDVLQAVEMDLDLTGTQEFPYNWMYDGTKDDSKPFFEFSVNAKAVVCVNKDAAEPDVGKADAYVDGKYIRTLDPHFNNWTHCNPLIILNEKESGLHKIRIQIAEGDEKKKFTILGFGIVK